MELLERLEISEINFSYVKLNSIFRFDSNYFQKELLNQEGLIRNHNYRTLLDYKADLKSFGAYSLNNFVEYLEEGVPFIRGINMKKGRILFENMVFISEKANDLLWKSEVKPEMILLSMSGTIGEVAIASKNWKYPINSNQDIAKIDTKGKINPYLLYTFLLSKFGQNYLKRESRGSVQQHVFLSQIEQFEIPVFDKKFIQRQEEIVLSSEELLNKSQELYSQAEAILLQEIGLEKEVTGLNPVEVPTQAVEGLNPSIVTTSKAEKAGFSTPNINVKSFKESFGVTGRLDAEYYQKKYEEVIEKIKSQNHKTLNEIVKITKSLEPGSQYYSDDKTGLPFMRVADYNKFGLSEPNKKLTSDFIKDNQKKIDELKPIKGSILFSKDGSVGTAYHLREDFEGITSSAILHLKIRNEKEVLPEYLTLALNSKLVQMQAERDAGGSIILHWRIGEIQNVVVPIINFIKQQQISKLVEESFSLKNESEHLLIVAKRAVEIAIEENEEIALEYINKNMK